MGLRTAQLADEIGAGDDVSPLIAAADLQPAIEPIVQDEKVVRLKQRVAELGVRNPLLALDAPLHRFLREQIVHGEVLADVARETPWRSSSSATRRCRPGARDSSGRRNRGSVPAPCGCHGRSPRRPRGSAACARRFCRWGRQSCPCRRRRRAIGEWPAR